MAYLLKCHPRPGVLYTQVGDFVADHSRWAPPDPARPTAGPRPVFNVTLGQPSTDVAAEVVAALAVASMVHGKHGEAEHAARLLAAAISVFEIAEAVLGPANALNPTRAAHVFPQCAPPEAGGECFYWTFADSVDDKLAWGLAWLVAAETHRPAAAAVTAAAAAAAAAEQGQGQAQAQAQAQAQGREQGEGEGQAQGQDDAATAGRAARLEEVLAKQHLATTTAEERATR